MSISEWVLDSPLVNATAMVIFISMLRDLTRLAEKRARRVAATGPAIRAETLVHRVRLRCAMWGARAWPWLTHYLALMLSGALVCALGAFGALLFGWAAMLVKIWSRLDSASATMPVIIAGTSFAAIFMLFRLRQTHLIAYGAVELFLSASTVFVVVQTDDVAAPTSALMATIAGAIYVGIRGLTNLVDGLEPSRRQAFEQWSSNPARPTKFEPLNILRGKFD